MNSTQGKTSAARTPMFTCISNTRRNNTTINHTYINYLQNGILYSLLYLYHMSNSMLLSILKVIDISMIDRCVVSPCIWNTRKHGCPRCTGFPLGGVHTIYRRIKMHLKYPSKNRHSFF
jgi:hypothetical protein